MKLTRAIVFCGGLLALTASSASATSIGFHVDINTAALVGLIPASGPFAVDFQLNGGSPLGNTAVITSFNFGGGSATPGVSIFGSASGDLASTVTLTSGANPFNELFQRFTPGSILGFDVSLTRNVNSPTPDVFSVAILDKDFFPIPTTSGFLDDSLVRVDIDSASLGLANVRTFSGVGAFADVRAAATPLPEPMSLLLVGMGLVGTGARRWRARTARQ